jgi:hypothetical protein
MNECRWEWRRRRKKEEFRRIKCADFAITQKGKPTPPFFSFLRKVRFGPPTVWRAMRQRQESCRGWERRETNAQEKVTIKKAMMLGDEEVNVWANMQPVRCLQPQQQATTGTTNPANLFFTHPVHLPGEVYWKTPPTT